MEIVSASTPDTLRLRVEQVGAHLRARPDAFASAATTWTPWHEPAAWQVTGSTPTGLADTGCWPGVLPVNPASVALALAEIQTARKILRTRAVLRDAALQSYLDAVEATVTLYENHAVSFPDREMSLAVALATARTNLQDSIGTLPGWLSISHAAGATRNRPPPARFISPPRPLASEEPTAELFQTWSDLHLIHGD